MRVVEIVDDESASGSPFSRWWWCCSKKFGSEFDSVPPVILSFLRRQWSQPYFTEQHHDGVQHQGFLRDEGNKKKSTSSSGMRKEGKKNWHHRTKSMLGSWWHHCLDKVESLHELPHFHLYCVLRILPLWSRRPCTITELGWGEAALNFQSVEIGRSGEIKLLELPCTNWTLNDGGGWP